MAGQEGNDGDLTLSEHLEELRHRLFIAALGAVAGTIIVFIFHRQVLEFLTRPAGDTQLIVMAVTEKRETDGKVGSQHRKQRRHSGTVW